MKKRNTVLAPLAEQDMLDIWKYMSGDDEARANLFLNSLQELLLDISDFPLSGVSRSNVKEGLRLLIGGGSNLLLGVNVSSKFDFINQQSNDNIVHFFYF